jgi:hypothetical protein
MFFREKDDLAGVPTRADIGIRIVLFADTPLTAAATTMCGRLATALRRASRPIPD